MLRSVRLLIILVVALSLALIPTRIWASLRWTFADQRYWGIDDEQVCRDGAVALAFHQDSTAPSGDIPDTPMNVVVRHYSNPDLSPPDESGFSDHPFAAYGPLVSATHTFTMTYQDEPWPPSFTDQPSNIYMYTSGNMRWFQPLEPGTRVVIESSFSDTLLDIQVEDCYLTPPDILALTRGMSETIGPSYLNIGSEAISPDSAILRLDALPAHGELRLDDSPLQVGDVFTQAAIDDNRLSYTHDGSATTADSFVFHMESTVRVSVDSAGIEANVASFDPSLSGDGRKVVFASDATNLVVNDSNPHRDIFAHDLELGQTVRVSVAGDETQADGPSNSPGIFSSFGYPTAFESEATNLVSEDCLIFEGEDGMRDVYASRPFLQRISVSAAQYGKCYQGNQDSYDPAIATYGSAVAFVSDATNLLLSVDNDDNVLGRTDDNGVQDVYLRHEIDFVTIVSVPTGESGSNPSVLSDGPSYAPSISADGEIVAFQSDATNLVADDTNGVSDIFVRSQDQTVRVSLAEDGTNANAASHAPAISADGRYVVFHSDATNLIASETNGQFHVFVYDRDTGDTSQISVASDGTQGNGDSGYGAISYTGRFVTFLSHADNLVPADGNNLLDIFVHDRDADSDGIFDEPGGISTMRVSVATGGSDATGDSVGTPSISADGHVIAFASMADNLVANDTNSHQDIFVHYRGHSHVFALQIRPPSVRLPWVSGTMQE